MERRNFLRSAAASAAAILVFGRRSALAEQAGSHIEVLIDEPIATIAPEIYGHFTEHIGTVIYDGIYVGEGTKIPNQNGLRSALIGPWCAGRADALPTVTTGATALGLEPRGRVEPTSGSISSLPRCRI